MAFIGAVIKAIILSGRGRAGVVVLVLGLTTFLLWAFSGRTDRSVQSGAVPSIGATLPIQEELGVNGNSRRVQKPVRVPANRSAEVLDGFRGDVHPILHGQTRLEVTAHWTALEKSRLKLEPAPDVVYSWYEGLR